MILTPPDLPASPHSPDAIPCIACGYDLRGSAPRGNCPECGESVYRSIRKDSIALADPAWALRIADGAHWLYVSIVITGSIVGGALFLSYATAKYIDATYGPKVFLGVFLLGYVVYTPFLAKAQDGFMAPEPECHNRLTSDLPQKLLASMRPVLQGFVVMNFLLLLAGLLMAPLGKFPSINFDNPDLFLQLIITYLVTQTIIHLVVFILCAKILTNVGVRLEDDKLKLQAESVRRTFKVSFLIPFAAFLFVCCGPLIGLLMIIGLPLITWLIYVIQVKVLANRSSTRIKFLVVEEAKRKAESNPPTPASNV